MMLAHLSLFTGIGGLDLAAEAAGFTTVGQCEWADYPTKVLEKHWPDVPRWRDIRTLTGADFYERTGLRTVDVISGGFPCQPFSVAGKRKGKEDDRYLWPEMLRVISEIRPTWVIGENVPGIVNLALDTVLSDLESIGYSCQTFIVPACGVDAPHRRYRVAVVGNSKSKRCRETRYDFCGQKEWPSCGSTVLADPERVRLRENCNQSAHDEKWNNQTYWENREAKLRETGCSSSTLSDTKGSRCKRHNETSAKQDCRSEQGQSCATSWTRNQRGMWPAEPDVGRMANGVPHRVDRLRCLGNAVAPPQFYPFFHFIAQIEIGGTLVG